MADSIDHTEPNARLRETLEGLRDGPDALIEIIIQQAEQIRQLNARVEELEQKVRDLSSETKRLREEREEIEREGKRQAAPFRTDEEDRSSDPDPPGRDEGHEASYRREPAPDRQAGRGANGGVSEMRGSGHRGTSDPASCRGASPDRAGDGRGRYLSGRMPGVRVGRDDPSASNDRGDGCCGHAFGAAGPGYSAYASRAAWLDDAADLRSA